jgi:hypothetical protein
MQQIDFSALPRTDPKYTKILKRNNGNPSSVLLFLLSGVFIIPVAVVGLIIFGIVINLLPGWFMTCLLVGVSIWLIAWVLRVRLREAKQLKMFAHVNGWQTDVKAPSDPVLVGLGYEFPAAKIGGTLDGCRFWLHTLQSPGSSNKDFGTLEALTIEVPRTLPNIFILPIGGMFMHLFGGFMENTLGLEQLSLEGDFNKYAAAYIQKGREVESLEYLTPDVMSVISDQITSMVLYSDRYIHICPNGGVSDLRHLEILFQDTQLILKEVMEKQRPSLNT